MDPLSILAGVSGVSLGWLLGRVSRRKPPEPSGSVCSCRHGYGQHADGGRCAADVERPHYYTTGDRNGWEWKRCPCLAYDGPEPLPRVWAP